MKNKFLLGATSGFVLAAVALPGVASAQTTAPAAAGAAATDDTIIITARKREERLQDVPLAVGVINAEQIESKGITDIARVANEVPGLTFDVGLVPSDTRVSLRGLQAVRGRPNVAILVDGIDTSSENFGVAGGGILANLRLVDVERIEVVKGPQNVLYGRSAFAGAINYITARPGDEFEGRISGEYASHNTYQIKGAVSIPLVDDKLSVRLNGLHYSTDGDYTSKSTGGDLNAGESTGGALSVLFTPTHDLSAYLRVQYSEEEYSPRASVLIRSVVPTTGAPNTADGGVLLRDRRPTAPFPIFIYSITGDLSQAATYRNQDLTESGDPNNGNRMYPGSDIETFRASLNIDWSTGFGDFNFLTGYVDNLSTFNEDFDHTNYSLLTNTGIPGYAAGGPFSTLSIFQTMFGYPLSFLPAYGLSGEFDTTTGTQQFSQEVRWAKDFGRVRATVDGLYWTEQSSYRDRSLFWLRSGGNLTVASFLSAAQGGQFIPGAPPSFFHLTAPPVTSPRPQRISRDTDSWSIAAALEFEITDQLTLDVEGRYIEDEIVYTGFNFDPFPAITYRANPPTRTVGGVTTAPFGFNSSGPLNFSEFTPRINLSWKPSDALLFYGSYAQGTKPGGVDTTDQNGFVRDGGFKPEGVETYELGAKFVRDDGRLTANFALFDNIYTDQQIGIIETIAGIPQSRTVNIGESESQGIELELKWEPVENLFFTGNYVATAAEYTDYVTPRCSPVDSAETQTPNCDFNGKKVPFTPDNRLNLGLRYEHPLSNGAILSAESNSRYESRRFANPSNLAWFPDFWETDMRIAYENGPFNAEIFANNVFEDDTPRTGTASVDYGYFDLNANQLPRGYLVALPPKRTVGIRVGMNF